MRTNKAMGLRNLPSKSWTVNRSWVLAANLAADISAWTRLLGLHDQPELADAEPQTLRYRLLHLPAKLTERASPRSAGAHRPRVRPRVPHLAAETLGTSEMLTRHGQDRHFCTRTGGPGL